MTGRLLGPRVQVVDTVLVERSRLVAVQDMGEARGIGESEYAVSEYLVSFDPNEMQGMKCRITYEG